VPGASSRTDGSQDPKFLTYIVCIDRKNEEAKRFQSRTYGQEMEPDHDPTIYQHAYAGSQKKGKKSISETRHLLKGGIFTQKYKSSD
jgi:hypothetical protein